jgi:hypothetical protein
MLCFVGTVQSGTFVMFFRYKIKTNTFPLFALKEVSKTQIFTAFAATFSFAKTLNFQPDPDAYQSPDPGLKYVTRSRP